MKKQYSIIVLVLVAVIFMGISSQVSAKWNGMAPKVFQVFDGRQDGYKEVPEDEKNVLIEPFCKNYPGDVVKRVKILRSIIGKDGTITIGKDGVPYGNYFAFVNENEFYRIQIRRDWNFQSVSINDLNSSEQHFVEKQMD